MLLSGAIALLVGALWGIGANPKGRLCNTMSISMFVTETAIGAIILASPTVAARYKDDLAADSVTIVSSPLQAEPVLGSKIASTLRRLLSKVKFNLGVPLAFCRQLLEPEGPRPGSQVEHILNRPFPDLTDSSAKDDLPAPLIAPLPHLERTADKPFLSFQARGLDTEFNLQKDHATVTVPSTSTTIDQGPYFFSVSNGVTIWLDGKTPPPSVSIVHHTSTIVVVPIASPVSNTSVSQTSSPITVTKNLNSSITSAYKPRRTTTITEVLTQYLTKTLTEGSHPGASSGSALHWTNTTRRAGSLPTSSTQATGASSGLAYSTGIEFSKLSSPTNAMHLNVARQLGVVVVATIDGATVSWINNYDGSGLTQSYLLAPPATTLVTVAKTTISVSSSTPDTAVTPGSTSFISVVPMTSPVVPTSSEPVPKSSVMPSTTSSLIQSTTTSPVEKPSTTASSTSCTETTLSKATVSTLATTITSTGPAAASSSAACSVTVRNPNNKGDFTVNFDDLPKFGASENTTQYPPIFSPYHHLNWVIGFAYVPPPTDPYAPISKPQLAAFLENPADNVHSDNGTDAGSFGVGDDLAQSALYFNAYSVYIGCTNKGPSQCEITFKGYIYEPDFQNQGLDALQVVYQPPCPSLINCAMLFIPFNDEFKNLTTLQITATVDGSPVDWYMDNLALGWADNSCDALEYRQNAD